MRLTLLGTGTSMGVPQIGCSCPVCQSEDPRDRRTRTAALVEHEGTRLLIDTPPELRLQLLAAGVGHVDAVLYTHLHADHVHGIDDLRSFSLLRQGDLPLYGPAETLRHLHHRFSYIFDDGVVPIEGTSKPRLVTHELHPGVATTIAGVPVLPLAFEHGHAEVFGYRFGPVAYVTDVKSVPDPTVAALRGVEVLVLNALWHRPHPTHLSIEEAVETARRIGAARTFLTHLTHETAHRDLLRDLPPGIEPGYDGLTVDTTR
ncbi:MAG TPA: MBL fold metallo-hydrolase [Gemmatimonadales bacterium]|nr:MBL fold metallo-hydrolase [Gemmatimonadales bacterium]